MTEMTHDQKLDLIEREVNDLTFFERGIPGMSKTILSLVKACRDYKRAMDRTEEVTTKAALVFDQLKAQLAEKDELLRRARIEAERGHDAVQRIAEANGVVPRKRRKN